MEHYGGAKCVVVRGDKILMVKHRHDAREYYTLPGGGIEKGESPEQTAIRELQEECNVSGTIISKISEYPIPEGTMLYTFYMDIGDQNPKLGHDPEYSADNQVLVEVRWMELNEICERDRAFLWASGLLCIPQFADELTSWGDDISYPNKRIIKHYKTNLIQTERLVLKKGAIDDYLTVYEYDFMKLRDIDGEFEYHKQDLEQIKKWFEPNIEQIQMNNEAAHIFDWIIYLKENMIPIGDICTHSENIENGNKETEIAFNLHPTYWGKGYMPEAIKVVLDYLFDLGYENIKARYSDGNIKSKRVLAKTGFKPNGVEKDAWTKNGKPIHDYKVIMNRDNWSHFVF